MSNRWNQNQAALLKGALAGLAEVALYEFVHKHCPAALREKNCAERARPYYQSRYR
jgi:hypothetical protein